MGDPIKQVAGILVLNLLIATFMMRGFSRAMERIPVVPRQLKIRHFLLSFLAIMLTAENIYFLLRLIFHPGLILNYYRPEGFTPAWFMAPVNLAGTILGAYLCVAASLLARRVSKARPVFLWLWPVYVLLSILNFILVAKMEAAGPNLYIVGVFSMLYVVLYSGASLLVFWHFRSQSSDVLFEPLAKKQN